MIKETKVLKEQIIRLKFCDVCGDQIHIGLACHKAVCRYCEKDLCEDCIGDEEETGGDYRIVSCLRCSEIRLSYKSKLDALEKERDEIYKEIRTKCKQK